MASAILDREARMELGPEVSSPFLHDWNTSVEENTVFVVNFD
jgi:hypothetical protein